MLQPGSTGNGTWNKKFIFSFSTCPSPFWQEMNPKSFSACPSHNDFFLKKMNSFTIFLRILQPGLSKNEARMTFFFFWIFLLFLWECSSLGQVKTISKTKFFFSFSASPGPVWLEMKPKRYFLVFFLIFLGMLQLKSDRNDSRNENFLSLFQPVPTQFV